MADQKAPQPLYVLVRCPRCRVQTYELIPKARSVILERLCEACLAHVSKQGWLDALSELRSE